MPTVTTVQPRADPGTATQHRLRPFPALDGLRAFAIAAVVLFHYPTHAWIPGGFLGVDVFFVLSGFLVTAGLLDEWSDTGTVRVGRFLRRRAWRLVPGLLALLAVFLVLAALFHGTSWFASSPFGYLKGRPLPMGRALAGAGAATVYSYNLLLAAGVRTPSPLGHLWTLAIEGQFYVGWVLVIRLLRGHRRVLLPLILAVIAGSAVLPWLLWHDGGGANQIYFGTAPRLQQLLAGAAVALLWGRGTLDRIPAVVLRVLAGGGAMTLLALCLEMGNVTFKYLGSLTVTAAASSAIVAFLVVVPAGTASRLLSTPALTWLGRRSYGVYLWHWPLAEWTNRIPHPAGVPLGITASLVLAELSWRLVEQPATRWSRGRRPYTPRKFGGRLSAKAARPSM